MAIDLNGSSKDAAKQLTDAINSGDEKAMNSAWESFRDSVADEVASQYVSAQGDKNILSQRGFRVLTSAEEHYYKGLTKALAEARSKQEFADIITNDAGMMPATVIDDVMRNIAQTHPLIGAVNTIAVPYLTKWFRSTTTVQKALWGDIASTITDEVKGGFEEVDATQNKLSAFGCISKDYIALGLTFLDGYVRTVLGEAIANGLEDAIINGTGLKQPVGLTKSVKRGVSVSTSTGYPAKTKEAITDFTPATYGAKVAELVKDENGNQKPNALTGGKLALICNNTDYLTKVMPATTVLNESGSYVPNLFPVPTQVITSAFVADGTAILCLLDEYELLVAGNRGIEADDSIGFLEDRRYFKSVMYAAGRCYDDTSAIVLDISKLDPAYINVAVKGTVTTKASA